MYYNITFSTSSRPTRRCIPDVKMAESECSTFTTENNSGSKVSLREVTEYHSFLTHFVSLVFALVSPHARGIFLNQKD